MKPPVGNDTRGRFPFQRKSGCRSRQCVEILVNEICNPNCTRRAAHYRSEAQAQLEYDRDSVFNCPSQNGRRNFNECMKRPAFISNEEIDSYIERGYVNFKIVGRGLTQEYLMESYLYFLVKEDSRDYIRMKMNQMIADATRAAQRR